MAFATTQDIRAAVANGGPISVPVHVGIGEGDDRWEIGQLDVALVVSATPDPGDPATAVPARGATDEPVAEQIAVLLDAAAARLREPDGDDKEDGPV